MNLELTEEEARQQAAWRDIAHKELPAFVSGISDTGELSPELLDLLRNKELLKPFLPTSLGGRQLGLFDLTLMVEELGRTIPALGMFLAQQVILGIWTNLQTFNLPDREDLACRVADLKAVVALAATENSSGSDLTNLESCCRQSEDGSVTLSGGKSLVNWAQRAEYVVTLARSERPDGVSGCTLILLPAHHSSVHIGTVRATLGMAGLEASPVTFSEVHLPAHQVIGVHGFGYDPYDALLNHLRISASATATGLAQQAFDDAAQYAKARKQFGKPVGSFQSLQWRFADAATSIDASRLHVWQAVERAGIKGSCFEQAAMAKVFAAETACTIADFAVQVFGGQGYLRECKIEQLFRDARFFKIGWGTTEILRNRISEYL